MRRHRRRRPRWIMFNESNVPKSGRKKKTPISCMLYDHSSLPYAFPFTLFFILFTCRHSNSRRSWLRFPMSRLSPLPPSLLPNLSLFRPRPHDPPPPLPPHSLTDHHRVGKDREPPRSGERFDVGRQDGVSGSETRWEERSGRQLGSPSRFLKRFSSWRGEVVVRITRSTSMNIWNSTQDKEEERYKKRSKML